MGRLRDVGLLCIGIGIGCAIFASTVREEAWVSKPLLAWVITGLWFALGVICFLAMWALGRRSEPDPD